LFIWSPVELGFAVVGNRVTATERIKELAEDFDVEAYFISGSKRLDEQSRLISFWFEGGKIGDIHLLPNLTQTYGLKLASGFFLSIVVCFEIIAARSRRKLPLVITREPVSSVLVLLACKILRIRSLYDADPPFPYKVADTIGGVAFQNPITRTLMQMVDYACLALANAVAIPDRQAEKELRAETHFVHPKRIVRLPFPIPASFFDTKLNAPEDRISLKFLGFLYDLYDFQPLIEAVGELGESGLKIELIVIGSGEQKETLLEFVRAKGFQNVHISEGAIPRSQIPSELADATGVVIPLRKAISGVPLKSVEAMAIGVPVLISNPRDSTIFSDGNTCICLEENSRGQWKSAIFRLRDRATRERVVLGAKVIAEQYRPGKNKAAIRALIE
jgi:glycosyltransferase involved in cell wall biosynthesis